MERGCTFTFPTSFPLLELRETGLELQGEGFVETDDEEEVDKTEFDFFNEGGSGGGGMTSATGKGAGNGGLEGGDVLGISSKLMRLLMFPLSLLVPASGSKSTGTFCRLLLCKFFSKLVSSFGFVGLVLSSWLFLFKLSFVLVGNS